MFLHSRMDGPTGNGAPSTAANNYRNKQVIKLDIAKEYVSGNIPLTDNDINLSIPVAPKEHRHLVTGGTPYTTINASEWADRRQCTLTGCSALHATRFCQAGEVLASFYPRVILPQPNYLTVQIGEVEHIMLGPRYLQCINHSCNPNVFFNTETMQLEALQDIQPGDELCFFYPSTEWSMDAAFSCMCGCEGCIGTVAGASQLTLQQVGAGRWRLTGFIKKKACAAACHVAQQ